MPRATPAGVTAEDLDWVYLAELDFGSGFVRATNAPFDITIDANGDTVAETYIGIGQMGGVGVIEEGADGKAKQLVVFLTGLDPALIATALNEHYQGRPGVLYRLWLDENDQPIGTAQRRFAGIMDTMPITLGETAAIGVTLVSRTVRWEKPLDRPRSNDSSHQARFPGDRYFENMPELIAGKEVTWGRG